MIPFYIYIERNSRNKAQRYKQISISRYKKNKYRLGMAEDFQARICGENWWSSIDSTRSVFPLMSSSSSPCSADAGNSCCTEETSNSVSDSYLGCFDAQKLHKSELAASGSCSLLIDSTLQMMGFSLPSSSTSANWNQPLLELQRDYWNPKSFSSHGTTDQVSPIDTFKPMNQEFNLLDQQSLISSLPDRGFPIGSTSCGFPSTLTNLYGPEPEPQPQPQHSLFTNRSVSYSSKANYGTSSNELSPIWSKVSTFLKPSPKAKQQPIGLHFSNKTPFWNASAEALNDIRAGAFASSQSQSQYQTPTFEEKPNFPSTMLNKVKIEETLDSASMMKKNVCEPALKRPRIETPPPLPTFKVRKEKLGDRVTALQQLVSPFGKTDTASVLHEAIEYIKFLQDQVSVLSTPYMKNETHIQQRQGCDDDMKDSSEVAKQDLRSRGLCLVPISSTFPVTTETTADFWTPAFGGTLLR